MKKCGRNDPCPCGSGKKFKKCCESKMLGGRFMATKIDSSAAPQIASSAKMTNFFQSRVSSLASTQDAKPIRASMPKAKSGPKPEAEPTQNEEKTGE